MYIKVKLQRGWGLRRNRCSKRVAEGGGLAAEVRVAEQVPRRSQSLSLVGGEEEQSRQREQTMQALGPEGPGLLLKGPAGLRGPGDCGTWLRKETENSHCGYKPHPAGSAHFH